MLRTRCISPCSNLELTKKEIYLTEIHTSFPQIDMISARNRRINFSVKFYGFSDCFLEPL